MLGIPRKHQQTRCTFPMAAGAPYTLSRGGHSHSWCSLKTCLLSVSNPCHGLEENSGHALPGARPRVGWGPT